MKISKYNILFVFIAFFMIGCSDYLDVNTDPTRISEDVVTMKVLLPTVLEATAANHYLIGATSARFTHHLDNFSGSYGYQLTMSGAWSNIYLKALNNTATILKKADDEGSPHYSGIAKVVQAVNLALLTDSWENAPVSEALVGSNNIIPAYDSQETIYATILATLDDALGDLAQEESFRSPSIDDIIYGGDLSKWIKLAHSLKARYLLHLSNKSDNTAAILAEIAQGFESNDDDFELIYNETFSNPWYFNIAKRITESIFTQTFGGHFIRTMNGEYYEVVDPRLPLIATTDTMGLYLGLDSWLDDEAYTVLPTQETFYMTPSAPLVMMSYSELKFIEAEAVLASNPTQAHDAYLAGVQANLDKLGVDADAATEYMAHPHVSVGGQTNLEHIMKEKYIALVLNPESWNDMRRYNYDPAVFKGFVIPDWEGRTLPAHRAIYPTSERDRNSANESANRKDQTVPMWKDL